MSAPALSPAPRPAVAPRPLDDDALIAGINAGDRSGWAVLVQRHAAAVTGCAWHVLRDRAEAEDVTQETFTRLLRKIDEWQPGRAQLRTWLHRVAVNLCIDRRRQLRRAWDAAAGAAESDAIEPGVARRFDTARLVGRAMQELPARQHAAIVLVHYQGLTNIEAAAALEIGVEALESLLARGRRALRRALAAHRADLLED